MSHQSSLAQPPAAAAAAAAGASSSSSSASSIESQPLPSSLSFSPSSFFTAPAPAYPTAPPPPPGVPPAAPTPASLDDVYGEAWAAKVARLKRASPLGREPGWGLTALISKANDDVRQEAFVMQAATPLPLWHASCRPHPPSPPPPASPLQPCPSEAAASCLQAIRFLRDAMPAPLWLRPYHILSTGPRSGLIEMVRR